MRQVAIITVSVVLLLSAGAPSSATPKALGRHALPTSSSLLAGQAIEPGLFSQIATGVGRVQARTCQGRLIGSGTGFLIGERVLMTARHVLKGACTYRVILGGRSYGAGHIAYWYTAGARDEELADVATLRLSRSAPGYVFSFARRTPALRATIAVIGFPLANPLSFNQGPLVATPRVGGIPIIAVRIATAKGSSGSPFLDPTGNVVGILQQGLVSPDDGLVWGLNLVRWWGPRIVRDLCRAYPQGSIPGCSRSSAPNCAASDQKYLDRLSRPYGVYVDRWNAWIDAGEPLDEAFRPTLTALNSLWLNQPDHLACSRGAERVALLIAGLQPGLDGMQDLLDQITEYLPGDPARADLEASLDAAIAELNRTLAQLEAQLTRLGFFTR